MTLSAGLYLIGQWSGLLALTTLGLLIFSGDTARYFDRFFGLDRIIKFQRKFSFFVAALVFLHPILFILSGQSFTRFFIPSFSVLPLAFGTLAFYIMAAVMLFSHYYKLISYKAWQYIHILTYALFFLAIYHAFFWGSDSEEPVFLVAYIIITLAVSIGVVYRTVYKLKGANVSLLTEKVWESEDTYTITVSPNRPIRFKAGQFCFLRIRGRKLHARHPFTISSAPADKELRFTIKDTGRFTSALSNLKVGDEIIIDGPFGRFIERANTQSFFFIAGGVGITPFRSLIRDIVAKKQAKKVCLLYFAKQNKDLVYKVEFDNLANNTFSPIYKTNEQSSERLSTQMIREAMKDLPEPVFYVCGPEKMKQAAKSIFKELRIPNKRIIIEDFFW